MTEEGGRERKAVDDNRCVCVRVLVEGRGRRPPGSVISVETGDGSFPS